MACMGGGSFENDILVKKEKRGPAVFSAGRVTSPLSKGARGRT